uniref:Uncharacterized protein n=1 Tax=Megaselia scalaris TaxID=36166 RepID=T1GRH5_MEGSC
MPRQHLIALQSGIRGKIMSCCDRFLLDDDDSVQQKTLMPKLLVFRSSSFSRTSCGLWVFVRKSSLVCLSDVEFRFPKTSFITYDGLLFIRMSSPPWLITR